VRGRSNANSCLDTRTYEIEFPDGRSDEYTANVIAENMYAQCDIAGRQYNLVKKNIPVRKTTKGWNLCVEWKDGTTIWERLADLKESNPVEVAEYAAANSLLDASTFV
jgi:hypothetical protein